MLAVKLHKRKRPGLKKGSYLIPILTWESGKRVVKNWINILDYHNQRRRNNRIRYITLVKIPDNHPVYLASDWDQKYFEPVEFRPLASIGTSAKAQVMDSDWMPEMILGEPLPSACVKWTKDIRLLYRSKERRSRRRGKADAAAQAGKLHR